MMLISNVPCQQTANNVSKRAAMKISNKLSKCFSNTFSKEKAVGYYRNACEKF